MKLLFATLVALLCLPASAFAARDRTPPTVPTGLRVVAVTEDSVTLRWNPSTDNSGQIHAYVVNGVYHPGNSTQKTITGLVPNWTQTYRVSALDAAGNRSAASAPLTATTAPDVTAPTVPGAVRVTATTASSVSLAWGASSDRWALWYEVLMDGAVVQTAGGLSARVRSVPPGTHTFAVRARDSGGNVSGSSAPVTVVLADTGDRVPPSAPSGLTATDLADFCGSVILRWGTVGDAVEYELLRNGALFEVVGATGSAFVYAPDGTSTWTVVAVDAAGNRSAASNPATVTVVADPNLC
ncbi:fibronectin type III domain-containing protein [Solirubrobacter taibaiensis]|nr:fibronectin type III domain-containing protein [Solirubrobacter taibaiensis]